jgi:hypothetical protein
MASRGPESSVDPGTGNSPVSRPPFFKIKDAPAARQDNSNRSSGKSRPEYSIQTSGVKKRGYSPGNVLAVFILLSFLQHGIGRAVFRSGSNGFEGILSEASGILYILTTVLNPWRMAGRCNSHLPGKHSRAYRERA